MPEISLDEWAANHRVKQRTAQRWAKERLIPAKKKALSKTIVKTWKAYMIDDAAPKPSFAR